LAVVLFVMDFSLIVMLARHHCFSIFFIYFFPFCCWCDW